LIGIPVDVQTIFGHEFGHELLSVHASAGRAAACSTSVTAQTPGGQGSAVTTDQDVAGAYP
jgi:hypothetical protein